MVNKKNDKKDKKKLLVLVLLLFMLIGVAGYGVYSYFWTQGSFNGTSNQVSIASFDPRTNINNDDFLGHGGSITISCPNSYTGNENLYCDGSITVSNNGGTDIIVEVLEASSSKYAEENMTANVSSPNFSWTSKTIKAGSSETLEISVPVSISSDYGSDSGVERTTPFDGSEETGVEINTSFKLKATQVH